MLSEAATTLPLLLIFSTTVLYLSCDL